MNDGKTVKLFSEAELAVLRDKRQAERECCGCPACPCGCNGIVAAIAHEG